jgi:hypothetical protein
MLHVSQVGANGTQYGVPCSAERIAEFQANEQAYVSSVTCQCDLFSPTGIRIVEQDWTVTVAVDDNGSRILMMTKNDTLVVVRLIPRPAASFDYVQTEVDLVLE